MWEDGGGSHRNSRQAQTTTDIPQNTVFKNSLVAQGNFFVTLTVPCVL